MGGRASYSLDCQHALSNSAHKALLSLPVATQTKKGSSSSSTFLPACSSGLRPPLVLFSLRYQDYRPPTAHASLCLHVPASTSILTLPSFLASQSCWIRRVSNENGPIPLSSPSPIEHTVSLMPLARVREQCDAYRSSLAGWVRGVGRFVRTRLSMSVVRVLQVSLANPNPTLYRMHGHCS